MAKIEIWEPMCGEDGCSKRATRVVSDNEGNELGKFCTHHANQKAQAQARVEAKAQKEAKQQ